MTDKSHETQTPRQLAWIDVVMIANLLIMVIIGGYKTFVSRLRIAGHPDQPELRGINKPSAEVLVQPGSKAGTSQKDCCKKGEGHGEDTASRKQHRPVAFRHGGRDEDDRQGWQKVAEGHGQGQEQQQAADKDGRAAQELRVGEAE